jgi:uncharacterized protein (DUF1778 family)
MKAKKKVKPVKRYTYLLKIAPGDARLIKEAAVRRGISLNAFINLAATGTARKVLEADPAPSPLPEEFISTENAA